MYFMWNWVAEQFSCSNVYYTVQDGFIFESAGEILLCDHSLSTKLPSSALPWCNSFFEQMPKLLKGVFF